MHHDLRIPVRFSLTTPRVLFLAGNVVGVGTEDDDDHLYGYDAEYGMGGDAGIHNMGRYIAVAPRNVSTSLRYLDFEA